MSSIRGISASAVLALATVAFGCVPPVDPAAVAAVVVVSKIEPPVECRALGKIEGQDTDRWSATGLSYDVALLDLRKKAVRAGGNHLVIDAVLAPRETDYVPSYLIQARLFTCPPIGARRPAAEAPLMPLVPVAAATAQPAAPHICEPDCSPGYTCLRGVCVSACNPACTGGERCGADRTCHPVPPPASSTSNGAPPPAAER